MSDLSTIPPPPRRVRWRAAARHRWMLGVFAAVLLGTSGLVTAVLAASGVDVLRLHDDALDAERAIADGEVVDVAASGIHLGRTYFDRIRYRYAIGDGVLREGTSFAPSRRGHAPGQAVLVEFAPGAPEISRIRDTRRNPIGVASQILIGALLLPSLAALLWWLRGALRHRLLLATGRLTLGRVVASEPVFGVNPRQFHVTFDWVDPTGKTQRSSQWVGQSTAVGRRVGEQVENLPAIVDDGSPGRAALVHPTDFLT